MQMAKFTLTPERRKEIFYAALDHSEGFRKSCGLTCTDVYGGFEEWLHRSIDDNWLVVAVTRDAAAALIQSGFDMKQVQRAHKMRRLDRYEAMIALPREEQYDFFMAQDQVTLATRAENHKNGTNHWSEVLPLPESIGRVGGSFRAYFTKPQMAAFVTHFGGI
jgi:hypothetical protein